MLMRHKNMIKSGIKSLSASKYFFSSYRSYHFFIQHVSLAPKVANRNLQGFLAGRYPMLPASEKRSTQLQRMCANGRRICLTRCYSTECNANNAGQNRKEGLEPESPLLENDKKKSTVLTRGARFRDEFLKRIVPWEKINDTWDTFPYYIHECDKNTLTECMASHLKHKKCTRNHGVSLASSSGRILLQSFAGSDLYRDQLVRTLARELQVPLMVLDSSVVPPYDFSQIDEFDDSDEEYSSESESDNEDRSSDDEDDRKTCVSEEAKSSPSSSEPSTSECSTKPVCQFKQGDRVKYVGESIPIEANNRTLSSGQRGEVHEVNGDKAAVVFYMSGLGATKAEKDEKSPEPLLQWLDVKHIEHEDNAQTHDCYVAMEVLCEVLKSQQPVIVYFPDSFWWVSRKASRNIPKEFFNEVKEMFEKLSGCMVLICGQDKCKPASKQTRKRLKQYTKKLKSTYYERLEMRKLFSNVVSMKTPTEADELKKFCKQIEQDWKTVMHRYNISQLHKVLKEHRLLCMGLESVDTDGLFILEKKEAEKIIGWATNHYLSSCHLPSIKEDQMNVPQASIEHAITRLKEKVKHYDKKSSSKSPKDLASGEFEGSFISALVSPGEIGVKFDDVGALEDVKNALNELVILPMKRPELFSHGNLLRPCKGMLLFGPPGTGKTLIAKALATEAGANFINVTGASLTSEWSGESEKYTRALFSFARKLTPVVVFLDEVDALLGARGGRNEGNATRKTKNEFMAAWDGLTSKDSDRILILGATNRPFDLDDAVIRRMPRRIYVGLPDLENRSKILKILLAQEKLESGFSFEQLAEATEGYSGSDLKNLCVAAAYKQPVQEFLKEETKGAREDGAPAFRPLKLDDFIHSKAKVAPSVAYNSTSLIELREWNERYGEGGSRK